MVSRTLIVHASDNFTVSDLPIRVTVADREGLAVSDTISITVLPVNDAPMLATPAPATLAEDDSLFIPYAAWFSSLQDPDDPAPSHTWVVSESPHLHVTAGKEGVTIKPLPDWNGADTLRIVTTDPGGLQGVASLLVRVTPVDDPVRLARTTSDTIGYADILMSLPLEFHDPDGLDSLITYHWRGAGWLHIEKNHRLEGRPRLPGHYTGTLIAVDGEGLADSISISFDIRPTDEAKDLANSLPVDYILKQNYPNPFNPSTTIRYGLPAASIVRITVYAVTGQKVAELMNRVQNAGYHEVEWRPSRLASGFYILETAARSVESPSRTFRATNKMILAK
jgi:hypothetical protein